MALLTSTHKPSRRILARAALAGVAIVLAVLGLCAPAFAAELDELKAAFVFQFANYVTWPESAFSKPDAPIVIGIVGNDAMLKTLSSSVRDKSVGKHQLEVIAVNSEKEAEACHIVFINASDDKRVDSYLTALRNKPVLTVSDDENFTQEGGVVKLFESQSKLRFEINVDEAERSKLTISSKLLSLAQVVHDKH